MLAAVREQVMRMIAEHRWECAIPTELAKVIAARERLGRETVRRWIVQADVDSGIWRCRWRRLHSLTSWTRRYLHQRRTAGGDRKLHLQPDVLARS
jgi:hypothetical protein